MAKWKQDGTVLRAQGRREQEGTPRPELNAAERAVVQKRLTWKRKTKIISGKRSYQPTTPY